MCHNIFIQNCDDMDSQRLPASRLVFRSNGYSPFTSVHQRRAVHAGVRIENAGNLSNHSHIKPLVSIFFRVPPDVSRLSRSFSSRLAGLRHQSTTGGFSRSQLHFLSPKSSDDTDLRTTLRACSEMAMSMSKL